MAARSSRMIGRWSSNTFAGERCARLRRAIAGVIAGGGVISTSLVAEVFDVGSGAFHKHCLNFESHLPYSRVCSFEQCHSPINRIVVHRQRSFSGFGEGEDQ
jgi:hypothetical protein